jgi:hypothetical protein
MAIKFFQMAFAGQASVSPQRGCLVCTDTLSAVTAAGYLSNSPSSPENQQIHSGDFIFVVYNNGSGGVASALFVATISNGVITLASPANEGVPSYVENITPGTSAPSKALVLDSSSKIDGVLQSDIEAAGTFAHGVVAGTTTNGGMLTLSAGGNLNSVPFVEYSNAAAFVSGITASVAELNLTHLQVASISTVSTTPATGSCGVQFQLLNAAAGNIAVVTPFTMYVCTSAGNLTTAVSSIAALTNGQLHQVVTGQVIFGTTNASGQIGITLTASTGTYYVAFVLPNGQYAISSAIVCN